MTWLHGRARTLAENVLTLSARGGRWGWLPPWASQDPKGRVRGRELQPEGPSHPAGTWPTSLPFCCPDQNCCPPPPIAWWLEGKNPFVKAARHVCPGGPALHHAPKKTKKMDNRMNAFLRPGCTRATSSGTGPRRWVCPEQSDTSSQLQPHLQPGEMESHFQMKSRFCLDLIGILLTLFEGDPEGTEVSVSESLLPATAACFLGITVSFPT